MNSKSDKETAKWRILIIGIGFILGVALLLFGGFDGGDGKGSAEKVSEADTESYRNELEKRVEELCSALAGSEVDVLVTLEGGFAYEYAADSRGGVVTVGSGSNESALVKDSKAPAVSGVGVVYKGDSAILEAEMSRLIQSALGIGANKIFIIGTKK